MEKNTLPYMRFYPENFFSSGNVMKMSFEEKGAHLMLIMISWHQNPVGSIPNDDYAISSWLSISIEKWQSIKEHVLDAWELDETEKKYFQSRVISEYEKLKTKNKVRHKSAVTAAKARWANKKETKKVECVTHSGRNADAMRTQCEGNADLCHLELDNMTKVGARAPACEADPTDPIDVIDLTDQERFQKIKDATAPCTLDECIISLHNAYGTENIEILRSIAGAFYQMNCKSDTWKGLKSWQGALRGFYERVRGDKKYAEMEERLKNDLLKDKIRAGRCETETICLSCHRLERDCECVVPDGEDIIEWRKANYVDRLRPVKMSIEDFLFKERQKDGK